ncbi:MAG: hypothetical protein DM484_01255 [Candidatus Methylumidiphilus alinenensis]|uniref:Uncharacterized protein n=1 Tax=Candidatus Methylumidiphilus alinenensis TaxID=2202197 RepID=A0A2W4RPY1_9GAMM|nr:MAG: hypothetical protein DM484_01255 [Candidatus Methylumidiphilus alinenensis]
MRIGALLSGCFLVQLPLERSSDQAQALPQLLEQFLRQWWNPMFKWLGCLAVLAFLGFCGWLWWQLVKSLRGME